MGKTTPPRSGSKIPTGGIPLPGMVTRSKSNAAGMSDSNTNPEDHSTSSSGLSLRKFDGRNFSVWRAQAEAYMTIRDCYQAITESRPSDKKLQESWDERNQRARATILLALDDNQAILVVHLRTAKEIWERLEMAHRQSSQAGRISLQRLFYAANMRDNENAISYVSRVQQIFTQLLEAGTTIDEEALVGRIVAGLTQNWHGFMTSWASNIDTPQTMAELLPRLKAEEVLIHRERRPAHAAYVAQHLTKKGNHATLGQGKKPDVGSSSKDPKPKCGYCKKKGHTEEVCRKKKREEQESSNKEPKVSEALIAEIDSSSNPFTTNWIIDTGATDHMCWNVDSFAQIQWFDPPQRVRVGGQKLLVATGIGTVLAHCKTTRGDVDISLNNVLLVPDLGRKLISIGVVTKLGYSVVAQDNSISILNIKQQPTIEGTRLSNNLYRAFMTEYSNSSLLAEANNAELDAANSSNSDENLELWHERLGHVARSTIVKLQKYEAVEGLKCKFTVDPKTSDRKQVSCEACILSKHAKFPIPLSTRERASHVGQALHLDICGPIGTSSLSGGKYIIIFKDEFSNYRLIYIMKSREETFNCIKAAVTKIYADTEQRVLTLVSDCGSEMTSNRSKQFFSEQNIVHKTSAPFCPQQNGFIERDNRTLLESIRAMLFHRKMPEPFWGEAAATAVYVLNRVINKNTKLKTAFELYFKRKPRVSHLRIFGSVAYLKAQHKKRSGYQQKLEARSSKLVMVGYDRDYTYRLYDDKNNKIVLSRDVLFDETKLPDVSVPTTTYNAIEELLDDPISDDSWLDEDLELEDEAHESNACELLSDDPLSYKEALKSPNCKSWRQAMDSEYSSLIQNNTWTLAPLPKHHKLIRCRWVYKYKPATLSLPSRFKARLVAKGFTQRRGVDYDEIFSPVVRLESVRIILSIVAERNLELAHFDVRTAFLYGPIDKDIYMSQPEGYEQGDGLACKLNKSIYGLKQASRVWNITFTNFLRKYNLKPIHADSCVFTSNEVILSIYVDDGLVATTSKLALSNLLTFLKSEFDITLNDQASNYVGLQITRNRESRQLHISQTQFAEQMLQRFGLHDAAPASIPMSCGIKFIKTGVNDNNDTGPVDVPYRHAIGCLTYLANGTRPDISFAVGVLSRFCEQPRQSHWNGVKTVLKYIKGTINHGLLFNGMEGSLTAFSDSDFAGCLDTRRSVSGFCILRCSAPIIWHSKKQSTVAESTTEAEFVSASLASREIAWVRTFLTELNANQASKDPTTLFVDNQSAIKLIKNNQIHSKIKHLDIKMLAIRERESAGIIKTNYAPSSEQIADILTKPVASKQFCRLRELLGVMVMITLVVPASSLRFTFESNLFQEDPVVELTFKINNPCIAVSTAMKELVGPIELSNDSVRAHNLASLTSTLCNEIYTQRVKTAIDNLSKCNNLRPKRNIMAFAKAAYEITSFIVGVTNVIRGASQESSTRADSHLNNIGAQVQQVTERSLTNQALIAQEAAQSLVAYSPSSIDHQPYVAEEFMEHPHAVWSLYKVINELYGGAASINAIADHCRRGKLATQELSEMLEKPSLALIKPSHTHLEELQTKDGQVRIIYRVEKSLTITLEMVFLLIILIILLICFVIIIRSLRMTTRQQEQVQDLQVVTQQRTPDRRRRKISFALSPL